MGLLFPATQSVRESARRPRARKAGRSGAHAAGKRVFGAGRRARMGKGGALGWGFASECPLVFFSHPRQNGWGWRAPELFGDGDQVTAGLAAGMGVITVFGRGPKSYGTLLSQLDAGLAASRSQAVCQAGQCRAGLGRVMLCRAVPGHCSLSRRDTPQRRLEDENLSPTTLFTCIFSGAPRRCV